MTSVHLPVSLLFSDMPPHWQVLMAIRPFSTMNKVIITMSTATLMALMAIRPFSAMNKVIITILHELSSVKEF